MELLTSGRDYRGFINVNSQTVQCLYTEEKHLLTLYTHASVRLIWRYLHSDFAKNTF